ncbi:6-phosphogluconolactonase [Marinobacter sp. VGCF2001]|uniref:6-phosphogluconolactonase n=1 Tax=Marinobacter sp. VGCF2001 TaxID=3417189 RepID=UPI003CEF199F
MKTHELDLPPGIEFHGNNSAEQTAEALALAVSDVLARKLAAGERASLAVSGGSTPLLFFRALADQDLDWSRVDILLVDERWVSEDDPASNTALVKRCLLVGRAAKARYFGLKQPGKNPVQALGAVQGGLSELTLPLDVVVLGMGNDGHTASLFPDAPELAMAMDEQNDSLVAAMTPGSQPHGRITLTRAVLSKADFTALHLKGEDKLNTLRQACQFPAEELAMPVRAFLKPGLEIFWSP